MLTPAGPPSVLTAVVRPARPAANVIEVDGAVFYSPVWGHAPGASVGVGRTLRDGHAGVRLLGAYQLARDVPLEGGTNEIQRFIAGATVTHRLERRRVFAAGDAGLVGTLTRAQGSGYATNRTASAVNFGVVAELRGGLRWGRARLWANGRVLRLVQDETVKVQSSSPGIADSVTLSPWDAQLGVGVGFLFE
jgi:hypothetical protein